MPSPCQPEASAWREICHRQALDLGMAPRLGPVLDAFPARDTADPQDPLADWSQEAGLSFGELERRAAAQVERLSSEIADRLAREVDADQARMFARRLEAVCGILEGLPGPEARLYRVGLLACTARILTEAGPRALRVRAVVDYYHSHAALLHHPTEGQPSLAERAAGVRWRAVAPGVEHASILGPTRAGPVHINLLRLRRVRLEAVDGRDLDCAFEELARREGAPAAISGGFFLYSEPDIEPPSQRGDPVGLLVRGGEVVSPPVLRRAAVLQDAAGIHIERIGLAGVALRIAGRIWTVAEVNRPERAGRVPVAFNRAWGADSPPGTHPALAVVGSQVVSAGKGSLPIPLAGFVLALPGDSGGPGEGPVTYRLPGEPRTAMAGGPLLLGGPEGRIDLAAEDFVATAPPVTFSSDETFDENLLPRMAAGLTGDGALVLAAIDGRNFQQAPGLTLRATTELMRCLGCQRAVNLDGGSSKRMVVAGEVVDLPSTEVVTGAAPAEPLVRPVRSGLLAFPEAR